MKTLINTQSILTVLILCWCSHLFAKPNEQVEWLKWKAKIEESYQKKFSSPTYTHHVYLKKPGDLVNIDLNFKYPRFVKNNCKNCSWTLIRKSNDILSVKGKKRQFNLPLEKETLILGEKDKYLSAYKDEKSKEIRVFLHDLGQKDLAKKRERTFYVYTKKHVYKAQFFWLKAIKLAKIQRSDGTSKQVPIVGEIKFLINKKQQILSIYNFDEETVEYKKQDVFMLLFRDLSNGKNTYGAGRFLNIKLPKALGLLKDGDEIVVDFNYSYNPPCAVSTGFHCPLPQDLVQKDILAGEKYIKSKK